MDFERVLVHPLISNFQVKNLAKVNNALVILPSLFRTDHSINLLHQLDLSSSRHHAVQPCQVCMSILGLGHQCPASKAPWLCHQEHTRWPQAPSPRCIHLLYWPSDNFIFSLKSISFFPPPLTYLIFFLLFLHFLKNCLSCNTGQLGATGPLWFCAWRIQWK